MEEDLEIILTNETDQNDYTILIQKLDEIITELSNDTKDLIEENENIQMYEVEPVTDYTSHLDQMIHYLRIDFYLLIVIVIFTLFRK